jgi:hypothetical protein
MRARQTVDTLDKLIDEILNTSGIDRTVLCMTIDSILDSFEEWLENSQDAKDMHPNPHGSTIFITEMKGPLYCLAGLNDYYKDMDQCVAWLRAGTDKMKMSHNLNL